MCPLPLPLLPQSADLSSNGLIVDEVSKVHGGSPGVILIEDAGAAELCLLPLGHGQLVPRDLWSGVRGPCPCPAARSSWKGAESMDLSFPVHAHPHRDVTLVCSHFPAHPTSHLVGGPTHFVFFKDTVLG